MFFQDAIQDLIFAHFIRFYDKPLDLWTPFKIKRAPIGDTNYTICRQMLQEYYVPLLWGASLEPTGTAEASKVPQVLILDDLLLILWVFWIQFS